MFCINCGANLSDDMKFCEIYGNHVYPPNRSEVKKGEGDEEQTLILSDQISKSKDQMIDMDHTLILQESGGESINQMIEANKTELLSEFNFKKNDTFNECLGMQNIGQSYAEFIPNEEDIGGFRKPIQKPVPEKSRKSFILYFVFASFILIDLLVVFFLGRR